MTDSRGPLPGPARSVPGADAAVVAPRRGVNRVFWGVFDQGLSSVTNFGLTAVVARSVSAHAFGAFSLAFGVYIIVLNITRAVSTAPMMMRHSTRTYREVILISRSATGSAVVVGLVTGSVCAASSLAFRGDTRLSLLAMGVSLPVLLLQDAWRFTFLVAGQPQRTALNDGVWVIAQVVTLTVVFTACTDRSPGLFILAWSVAAGAAAIYGVVQARTLPRPWQSVSWWRQNRRLASATLGDVTLNLGSTQLIIYTLAALVGTQSVGAVRGATLLFGPLTVIYQGAMFVAVPEMARLRQRKPDFFVKGLVCLGMGLAALAFIWTCCVMFVPASLGRDILGATWPQARTILLPIGLALSVGLCGAGATTGIGVLAVPRSIFLAQAWSAPVGIFCAVLGTVIAGLSGYAWGAVAGGALGSLIYWWYLRAAVSRSGAAELGRPAATTPLDAPATIAG